MDTAGERRWAVIGMIAATAVAVIDALIGPEHVFVTAVVIGPAFAAVACRPLITGLVASYALVLAVVVGSAFNDLTTADEFVRYVAIALVGATLTLVAARRDERERKLREVTKVAEVAQRTILRALPAELGPFVFAARYMSASHDALVGGDFYDACETAHGVRAVVGDVRGKGLDAVEMAADALGAFRAAAHLEALEDVVGAVDRAVGRMVGAEDFVTAIFVQFNEDGTVCFVNCGHPPPLFIRDGGLRFVEAGRTRPLGLDPEATGQVERLASGERVLLYTDGLIEARSTDGGFFALDGAAGELGQGSLEEALDGLLRQLVEHSGTVHDDVAVVLAQAS